MLNQELKRKYNYEFSGFYNVTIYCYKKVWVLEFNCIDDYGTADFNITMLLNSVLLYEFEDSDMVIGNKIYYQKKFYVEIDSMMDDIHLFEYGKIVYGDKVQEILHRGTIISI
jgi:hypothetical protein